MNRVIYKIQDSENISIVIPSGEIPLEQVIAKDIPQGAQYSIVEISDIPNTRLFRSAWEADFVNKRVNVNLPKAKIIAHEKRRVARAKEFSTFDDIVSKQIPGKDAVTAESERQKIRDKYAIIQTDIDNTQDVKSLTTIVNSFNS